MYRTPCQPLCMERPQGKLFVGEQLTPGTGERSGEAVLLSSADFTTHGVIVGMTGSGKTGLGIVLLEEALASGIPVLAIDPKGDLGNLALNFPDLAPSDFEPWIDEGAARVAQTSVADLATKTAESWRSGLASWGLDGSDVARLGRCARPIIYTPGSNAGVSLNALGRLTRPASDDPSVRQDEADATISGLLGLVGIESDPLAGREHILLANLITRAWESGTELDLPSLLGQILDPPIRKLGVLDLETFYPADDRRALVLRLNGLLASPSFSAWAEGVPLDIGSMLWDPSGSPRAAIVSLAHLDEPERHFAITLVLSRVISWMRTQSGTSELRALIYIDELMGLAPPVGNPPPKKPILTLLKQARAFGVGLVLSTQNPVDLDYKAISNAGTWMIGRLQTEQDKNRLVDGLRGADGGVDVAQVKRVISSLGKRQFVLRTSKTSELPLFTTRWAMSYLAGPMTREQISLVTADQRATAIPASSAPDATAVNDDTTAGSTPSVGASGADLAEDESIVPPTLPDDLLVRYLHPSAPWGDAVGADPRSNRLVPMLAARVTLLFDDTASELRHIEEWEALLPLHGDAIDVADAISVDFDDRDLVAEAPAGVRYVPPGLPLTKATLRNAQTSLKARLHAEESLALHRNAALKLVSRPGESEQEFTARCHANADEAKDAAAEKIRTKLEAQRSRIEAALAKAEDRVNELEVQQEGNRTQQFVDLGTSLLGGLLGGRRRASGMATAARRAASGRRQAQSAEARLDTAENRVAEKVEELEELEHRLQDAIIEIDDEWSAKAEDIEPIEVTLEKADITITDFVLVWVPMAA